MGKRKTRSSQRKRRASFPNAPLPPPSTNSTARPRGERQAAQAPSRIGQRTEIPGFEYDPVRDRYFKVISTSQGSAPPSQTTRTQSFLNEQLRVDRETRHIQELNNRISEQQWKATRSLYSFGANSISLPRLVESQRMLPLANRPGGSRLQRTIWNSFLNSASRKSIYKNPWTRPFVSTIQAFDVDTCARNLYTVTYQFELGFSIVATTKLDTLVTTEGGRTFNGNISSLRCVTLSNRMPALVISILEDSDYLATVEFGSSDDRYSITKSSPIHQGIHTCALTHIGVLGYILNGKCYWIQIDSPSKAQSQQGPTDIIQSSEALSMAHSLSGNTFYGGFRNGRVQLYDIRASRSPMRGFHESSAVCDILPLYVTNNALDPYSCDSPYIYTSVMNGQINLWDLRNLKGHVRSLPGHVNQHQKLNLTFVENSLIVAPGSDHVIRAWSLDSGALVGQKVIPGTPTQLTTVRYGSSESKPILTNDGHPVWSGLFVSHGPEITMLSRP